MKLFPGTRMAALGLAVLATACTSGSSGNKASVEIRGSDPNAALNQTGANTLNNTVIVGEDSNGIVTYDGYQTAKARSGDTVASVADRIGLSASQLGAYNGLPVTYALRPGDELALPPRPGGYGEGGSAASVTSSAGTNVAANSTTGSAPSAIEQTPLGGVPVNPDGTISTSPTVPIPDATAGATATTVDQQSGWSPDVAAAAIDRSSDSIRADGSLGAPPSSAAPVPDAPERRELSSPGLSQYQTEESQGVNSASATSPEQVAADTQLALSSTTASSGPSVRMRRPVEGPVAIGFNKGSGPSRNDGVDFAAPAGAKVVAAADGEVALVSQSLGGLGTIVLVRHPNELLTVYGRIDGVLVKKGDIVSEGQQIGVVSNATAPAEPRMHFEVRRGSESLDPMQFL